MLYPHQVTCPCGIVFTAIQPSAKYHSNACRCKAYRQRQMFQSNTPIAGFSVEAAAAFNDVCENTPALAQQMIRNIRINRGVKAAVEATYIALAACCPYLIDPGLETGQYHYSNIPEKLKGVA